MNVTDIISDPFTGPYEGEDYFIDETGVIHVPVENVRLAAMIMRKVNASNMFENKLVKVGQGGDSILLDFDALADIPPVFATRIGPKQVVSAEVKTDGERFYVYIDGKRNIKISKKLAQAKTYIKRIGKQLEQTMSESTWEDADSEE